MLGNVPELSAWDVKKPKVFLAFNSKEGLWEMDKEIYV
jgi:hypothetical protein